MKKGFFLLEALFACTLLMVLVGSIAQHYGQWARNYKTIIQQKDALTTLMLCIEKRNRIAPEPYRITQKKITVESPKSTASFVSGITYPNPQCTEIIVSWQDNAQEQSLCAVMGSNE